MNSTKDIVQSYVPATCFLLLLGSVLWFFSEPITITELQLTKTWTYTLPFAMPRWWDVFIFPIYAIGAIHLYTNKSYRASHDRTILEKNYAYLVVGFLTGCTFMFLSTASGFPNFYLGYVLVFTLLSSLFFGLIHGLGLDKKLHNIYRVTIGPGFAIGCGLFLGFAYNHVLGFATIIACLASVILGIAIGKLARRTFSKAAP